MTGSGPVPAGISGNAARALQHPALPVAYALAALGYEPKAGLWSAAIRIHRSPVLAGDLLAYVEAGMPQPVYADKSPSSLFRPLPGGYTVASLVQDYGVTVTGAFLLASDLFADPGKARDLIDRFTREGYWVFDGKGMHVLKFPPIRDRMKVCPACDHMYPVTSSTCPSCGTQGTGSDDVGIEDVARFIDQFESVETIKLIEEPLPQKQAVKSSPVSETPLTGTPNAPAARPETAHVTTCPSCKAETPKGAKFCRHCGAAIAICPSCGAEISQGAKFCRSCGKSLGTGPAAVPVCPKCGNPLHPGKKFCVRCGATVED